jgi:hypothetical protein
MLLLYASLRYNVKKNGKVVYYNRPILSAEVWFIGKEGMLFSPHQKIQIPTRYMLVPHGLEHPRKWAIYCRLGQVQVLGDFGGMDTPQLLLLSQRVFL